jgi:hypothetical protein
MAPRRVPIKDDPFPPFTCGACDFVRREPDADKYWCWGNPVHVNPFSGATERAHIVENPHLPACHIFKARMHS